MRMFCVFNVCHPVSHILHTYFGMLNYASSHNMFKCLIGVFVYLIAHWVERHT